MASLTLLLSLSTFSQAEDFIPPATQNALQEQGFIRQDTGGPVGSGEMALDPFRNADQLNFGGLFGPLQPSDPLGGPFPFNNPFGNPPDTRSMGFASDPDHYVPIARLQHVD